MRTITEQRRTILNEVYYAQARACGLTEAMSKDASQTTIRERRERRTRANLRAEQVLDAALAEVPRACRERIEMWSKVIARSTDDDEIRDAQAAQSELRWLLLQLEGEA